MLNKKISLLALMAGLAISYNANASDGQINFTGTITDETCTVTNSPSSPLSVTLGSVAKSAFSGVGSTAAATKFTIMLTGCPQSANVNSVSVKFDGIADGTNKDVLALTAGEGVAEGVGIQLTEDNGTVLPLFSASSSFTLADGDNKLNFIARYIATSATVTAGTANAVSNFTIIYN
uniref:Fimbrial protein n=1 Tax=Shewanella sp. (strain MR-7) TaxID=60481 RepID=Q0HR80_SHESR